MRKWLGRPVIVSLVLVGTAAALVYPKLSASLLAANGYAAKWVCSGVFVSGRSADNVIADLPPNPLASWVDIEVDVESRRVTAGVSGLFPRQAIFRDGYGCTLVPASGEAPQPLPPRPLASDSELSAAVWPANGEATGFDDSDLQRAVAKAFDEPDPQHLRNTRAVVVVWQGQVVAERYGDGFDATTRQAGWSMTKSVINALVGRMVHQELTQISSPVKAPEWSEKDERQAITLDQALRMSSGLRFSEDYGGLESDVVRMLFVYGDTAGYAASLPLEAPPDTVWSYSSGTTNVISRYLRQELDQYLDSYLDPPVYWQYPWQALFEPLGMTSFVLEPDAAGTFVGSSFGWARARDWARFGLLYLQDGVWQGERLLPAGWVQYSTTPTAESNGRYGAHFWLNADPESGQRRWPALPPDLYLASGFDGQSVVVAPSHQCVIVRLGLTQDSSAWDLQSFLAEVLAVLPPVEPSPVESLAEEPSNSTETQESNRTQ